MALTRTTRLPSKLIDPASTADPEALRTGMGSPVSRDSSAEESPSSTTASTGTWSPGLMRIRSPVRSWDTGVSTSCPAESTRRAVVGANSSRALRAFPACALIRASSAWPTLMRVRMLTDSAKKRCAWLWVKNSHTLNKYALDEPSDTKVSMLERPTRACRHAPR